MAFSLREDTAVHICDVSRCWDGLGLGDLALVFVMTNILRQVLAFVFFYEGFDDLA